MYKNNQGAVIIIDTLSKNGYQGYIVGGAVRDYLLGKTPKDYDIATNATPDEVIKIFSNYKTVLTGLKHGTVGIIINYQLYEVTTFRTDGAYLDNRHPLEVAFTSNLYDDLSRRDFTINAFAYQDNVIDYFNGLEDLENKVIRCVNEPNKRFQEDALRILRALRFASVLGFRIEDKTKEAIFANYHLLEKISSERIRDEFYKMLLGDSFVTIYLEYFEVLKFIIPILNSDCKELSKILLKVTNESLEVRLAILFKNVDLTETVNMLKKLHFSKETINTVQRLIENQNLLLTDKISYKLFLSKYSIDFGIKFIEYKNIIDEKVDYSRFLNYHQEIIVNRECVSLYDLNINGNDLLLLGICPKKRIGEILNMILDLVINEKLDNDHQAIIQFLKENHKI